MAVKPDRLHRVDTASVCTEKLHRKCLRKTEIENTPKCLLQTAAPYPLS